jgi:hypothetical protein
VVEDLLDNPDQDLSVLGVRGLRDRIRELEAATANTAAERDAAIAERDGLSKQLRRRTRDAEDAEGTPAVIADMRLEIAELVKKAELSLASLYPIGPEVLNLVAVEGAAPWVHPTLRLALSGLVALRIQVDGLIGSYAQALGDDARKLQSQPDALAFLDDGEIKAVAEEWGRLVAVHQHEEALRAHEREQARPKGKGRPKAAPKAPGAAA